MNIDGNKKDMINEQIFREIIAKVASLHYGEIRLVVHNSRIVQVEKIEKIRFDDDWCYEKGGGI